MGYNTSTHQQQSWQAEYPTLSSQDEAKHSLVFIRKRELQMKEELIDSGFLSR
jgi:hypothetical protein